MNSAGTPLRIGYIPLVDAAALIVAVAPSVQLYPTNQ